MLRSRQSVMACLLLSVGACSGTGSNAPEDLSVSTDLASPFVKDLTGTEDLAVPVDLLTDYSGVRCGSMTCQAGDVCCISLGGGTECASSCTDGGIVAACDGPEDCTSGAPYCCAHLEVGYGTLPNCPVIAADSDCRALCDTMVPLQCPAMGRGRLCHTASDCTADPSTPNCCTFVASGGGVTFCVDSFVKQFAAVCH